MLIAAAVQACDSSIHIDEISSHLFDLLSVKITCGPGSHLVAIASASDEEDGLSLLRSIILAQTGDTRAAAVRVNLQLSQLRMLPGSIMTCFAELAVISTKSRTTALRTLTDEEMIATILSCAHLSGDAELSHLASRLTTTNPPVDWIHVCKPCMCVCMYVYMHASIYACTRKCIYVRIYACTRKCICVCSSTRIYVGIYVCMSVYVCISLYACVCMLVCINSSRYTRV